VQRLPIPTTANPMLELGLQFKLRRRAEAAGSLGELEAVALRLGMIQGTLRPRFHAPQLVVFAADHGLAVEGVVPAEELTTAQQIGRLLSSRLPLAVFARLQQIALTVVDCGVATPVAPHPRLMARKVAHGSRSARIGAAMSLEQTQAAIRTGMEVADALPGNVLMCAGLGAGGLESGALVLSRLTGTDSRELVDAGDGMSQDRLARLMVVLHTALDRHQRASGPLEVLAALGGYDIAAMVGAILVAASRRHLIVLDGMAACAALLVATRFAPEVRGYGLCCHSHGHRGLQRAHSLLDAGPLLELGLESVDGIGSTLAWPLLMSAAALLSEVTDTDEPLAEVASAEPMAG
jgi:nicotinate-nucleotide--dimethylbenzimidazole phosphoribosyltransferase